MATIPRFRSVSTFPKPVEVVWNSFRRGVNKLLQDVELSNEEFRRGDNVILTGSGIVTQRPGSKNYFLAGSGKVRRVFPFYKKNGTKQLVAFTDLGYFTKKNGASYTIIPGASLPSGTNVSMAQIYDTLYIAAFSQSLLKHDGATIYRYVGISRPTNVTASKISGASGVFTWGWRVSAESDVGETLASEVVTLSGLPEHLTTEKYVILSWNSVPGAKGYVIYGRDVGNETFLARVPSSTTTWIDDGNNEPSFFVFPPEVDYTAGPKAKYCIAFSEKLVMAHLEGNPSRVVWSGGGQNVDKFHWSKGGGYVDISKDDGEVITGVKQFENRIIVFKERSIYELRLVYNADLGIVEPVVIRISGAVGAISNDTIVQVENDLFFMGRRVGSGVSLNALGYEPNIANVLRTSEISARMRPELENVNVARAEEMFALYTESRYWLFYPVGTTQTKCLVYDRERLAWTGPHSYLGSPSSGTIYYDENNEEKFLYGANDGYVVEIGKDIVGDRGEQFTWTFETKREYLKDPFLLKNLLAVYYHLRNLQGTVSINVYAEQKGGSTISVGSYTITGSDTSLLGGFGSFNFGSVAFGGISQASKGTIESSIDTIRYSRINRKDIRSVYIQISGTGSKADIVALKILLQPVVSRNYPVSWNIET